MNRAQKRADFKRMKKDPEMRALVADGTLKRKAQPFITTGKNGQMVLRASTPQLAHNLPTPLTKFKAHRSSERKAFLAAKYKLGWSKAQALNHWIMQEQIMVEGGAYQLNLRKV